MLRNAHKTSSRLTDMVLFPKKMVRCNIAAGLA
jgi:hypothetical protein